MMEPIVEIMEQADYKAYRAYYYFANRRRPMSWLNWLCAYASIPAMTIYYHVVNLFWYPWNSRSGILFLLYIVLDIALIIYITSAPRRAFKQRSRSFVTGRTAFFEDHYSAVINGESSTQEGSFAYGDIEKAYETTTAFYVKHINKGWGFFPKKFFAPGQVEALRDLFARKFGERFKTK